MSETPSQTEILAPDLPDVLPGYVLSPIPFVAYAELEDEFARRHVSRLVAGAMAVDPTCWDRAMRLASDELRDKRFGLGDPSWDPNVQDYNTVPLLLYLSLRVTKPDITRTAATALLNDGNFHNVRYAMLRTMGFRFFRLTPKTPAAGGPQTPNAGPSTSAISSTASETTAENTASAADSVTTKSAA